MPVVCFVGDFCKEEGCMIYSPKIRVNSVENPSDLTKHFQLVFESFCIRNCSYTTRDFQEWMKTKEPSYLARKLFVMEQL